jgi:hypothetical protein
VAETPAGRPDLTPPPSAAAVDNLPSQPQHVVANIGGGDGRRRG